MSRARLVVTAVLAIEPMFTLGHHETEQLADGSDVEICNILDDHSRLAIACVAPPGACLLRVD